MSSHSLRDDDAFGTLREALRELERFGLNRPPNASIREYIAALVNADVIPRPDADLITKVYNARQFGNGSADKQPVHAALYALRAAAAALEILEPARREQIAEQLRKRFAPAENRAVAPRHPTLPQQPQALAPEAPPLAPIEQPFEPPFEPAPFEAEMTRAVPASETSRWARKRILVALALGLALWTIAAVSGVYLWRYELETFINDAKIRLGWEDRYLADRQRSNWNAPTNRPTGPSEFSILMGRAAGFDAAKQTRLAIDAYELALNLEPKSALANNNFAWILLTTDDAKFRDPVRALRFAKAAVDLERMPAYLDTLAEASFQNGDAAKAVELEEEALSLEDKSVLRQGASQSSFLEKQLEKFRKGLGNTARPPEHPAPPPLPE